MRRWSQAILFVGAVALATSATISFALAQDDSNSASSQDSGGQDSGAQANNAAEQKFDEMYAKWRAKLDAMRKLQVEYKLARPEEQNGLEEQFSQLLVEAKEMSVELRGLVEDAYKANPADQEKADFLFSMAFGQFRQDNFPEALRICHVLIENNYQNAGNAMDMAGQCEYLLNNYTEAEKLLRQAEEVLANVPRQLTASAQAMLTNLEADRTAWQEEVAFQEADAKPDGDPMALPRVELDTTQGKIVIELFENEAPNTVANFVTLVRDNFYDGLKFHRVIEGFMAQGGDPAGDGSGDAGYSIPFESEKEPFRKHFRGAVAMAHGTSRDSGGSQFYIVFRRDGARHLDGEHTVFGRVIEGMDVVSKFARLKPNSQETEIENPDRILKATVLNARDHDYTFRKVGDPPAAGDAAAGSGDDAGGDGNDAGGSGNGDAGGGQ